MGNKDLPFLEEEVTLVLVNNGENETGNLINVLDKVGKELVSLGLYNSYKIKQTKVKPHQIFHTDYMALSSKLGEEFKGENIVALLNGDLFYIESLTYNDFAIKPINGCGDIIPIGSIVGARVEIKEGDFEAALCILLHEIFEYYYAFRMRRGAHFEEHEGNKCAMSHKNRGPKICNKCKEWLKGEKKRYEK